MQRKLFIASVILSAWLLCCSLGQAKAQPTLKEAYQEAFKIGTAINTGIAFERDSAVVQIVETHFNSLSPESDMKAETIHPSPDRWDFSNPDRYVEFGRRRGMHIHAHTLLWHNQTPAFFWFNADGSRRTLDAVKEELHTYIKRVCSHYRGKVDSWDVVNEVVAEDGGYADKGWVTAFGGDGDELVRLAFRYAAKYDPHAELYLNEYNVWRPEKLNGILRIVRMLRSEGIRIDGVGIQGHWGLNYPELHLVEAAIDSLAANGLKVAVTELDIDVLPLTCEGQVSGKSLQDPLYRQPEFEAWLDPYTQGLPESVQAQLTQRYRELFELFYRHRHQIDRVALWGVHDAMSWKNHYPIPNRTNYPLLFDRQLAAKPALQAVIDVPTQSEQFPMPVVTRPEIPARRVSLSDFGAVGDGQTLCSDAFREAIEHLSQQGGGHLDVPAGVWLTGPIELKSNIDLHVTPNAVIVFSPDWSLYPMIDTDYEAKPTRRHCSPIHAENATNISITGGGIIDGNGDSWRWVKRYKMNQTQWQRLLAKGGVVVDDRWYPSADAVDSPHDYRPDLLSLRYCDGVLLEDCVFQNSANWNVHPQMCRNMIINRITVRNPYYANNGDALDLTSCENVYITNSLFDAGDDAICIKSGLDREGRERGIPCQNIIVDNCTVYHGHGGFTVGSEMSGGVRNIRVTNCRFLGTDVGLRFKSKRGRGGVVENIWIENIYMKDIVGDAISFTLFYGGKSVLESAMVDGVVQPLPVDETTPEFRDIHIRNVVCAGAARAMDFFGLPEMSVRRITIDNCAISANRGIAIRYAEDVRMNGVRIECAEGEPVLTEFVKNVTVNP